MANDKLKRIKLIKECGDGQSATSSHHSILEAQERIARDLQRCKLKGDVSYEIVERYPEQTIYESMVDTIEDWMHSHVYQDEDGLNYHKSAMAKAELESLLEQFAEDVLQEHAADYVQETGGRPE